MDQPPAAWQANADLVARLQARLQSLETRLQTELDKYTSLQGNISPRPVSTAVSLDTVGEQLREPLIKQTIEQQAIPPRTIEQWIDEIKAAASGIQAETCADPLVSVITPLTNVKPEHLAETALSLLHQTLTDWEWRLVDAGATRTDLRELLPTLEAIPRIHVQLKKQNGGIGAGCNQALQMATGKFVCFLEAGALAHDALERCTKVLAAGFDAVYTDEDQIGETGVRSEPVFKPEWSPEYLRGVMYVGHFLCVRRDLAIEIGGFDSRYDAVHDFEFLLRYSERTNRIAHVSQILYHSRITESVVATKQARGAVQLSAVQAQLNRLNLPADVAPSRAGDVVRVVPRERNPAPKISIIIPTKDASSTLSNCLVSLFGETRYAGLEVICVDNDSQDVRALGLMQFFPVKRLLFPGPFNFSSANNLGAQNATGPYLVFMNNDIETLTPDWVEQMLYYAEQDDVGAVGGLLLYPDRSVQHAGVVLGCRGTADHVRLPDSTGYGGPLACAHEVSAVTAACLMMRRELFLEIGGFNPDFFSIYQDVDLCLRLRSMGKRNIFTPHAVFIHHESHTRGHSYDLRDRKLLLDRWEPVIQAGDPYYNPNLDVQACDYSVKRTVSGLLGGEQKA